MQDSGTVKCENPWDFRAVGFSGSGRFCLLCFVTLEFCWRRMCQKIQRRMCGFGCDGDGFTSQQLDVGDVPRCGEDQGIQEAISYTD